MINEARRADFKVIDLKKRFDKFETQTNQEISCLKDEVQNIKNNTDKILAVNETQNELLNKLLEKSFDANLKSTSFLQKLSGKQLAIIGGIITALIVLIKVLMGI